LGEMLKANSTEHICADCGEAIVCMEEVFLLQVIRPQRWQGQQVHHIVIDEHDPEGCFRFEPYYFCFNCWEKTYEEIHNDMQDELPVNDCYSEFECTCCGSGIRGLELAGLSTLGEFHVSERAPNGMRDNAFIAISNPDLICIYCMTILNNGYIDMWENLNENEECDDCVQARCWRVEECACRCHHSPPDEDEEEQTDEFTQLEYRGP
jgi:hypothetical protein